MTLPTTTGRTLHFAPGARLVDVVGELRAAGWQLISGPRGRAMAKPLH